MKPEIFFLLITNILFVSSCKTNSVSKVEWNDLKVTWGINPFGSNAFISMPRTEPEAIIGGWKKGKTCAEGSIGNRYILNGDRAVILIFNSNGIIAGIASSLPKNLPFNFPSNNLKKMFVDEGDVYTINAYFQDPDTVCNSPITMKANQFSTGDRLVFKGTNYKLEIQRNETQLDKSFWTLGQCYKTMGIHYWANIFGGQMTEDISSDDFVPVFLQFNRGRLNGFGWAFNADLPSTRYEHPTPPVINRFFKIIPKFFSDPTKAGVLSTLHIFLDDTPHLNNC